MAVGLFISFLPSVHLFPVRSLVAAALHPICIAIEASSNVCGKPTSAQTNMSLASCKTILPCGIVAVIEDEVVNHR